jgi:methionine-R-sulfoxide reductase
MMMNLRFSLRAALTLGALTLLMSLPGIAAQSCARGRSGEDQAPSPPSRIKQKKLRRLLKRFQHDQNQARFQIAAKRMLSPLEFRVAFQDGTEYPFQNRYWDQKQQGIYADLISGIPLFSSTHKFRSGTGWPSFDRALNTQEVVEIVDRSYNTTRIEIRTRTSGIHLGHVFSDGPRRTTGRRFCLNSAVLIFIPLSELNQPHYRTYRKRHRSLLQQSGLEVSTK